MSDVGFGVGFFFFRSIGFFVRLGSVMFESVNAASRSKQAAGLMMIVMVVPTRHSCPTPPPRLALTGDRLPRCALEPAVAVILGDLRSVFHDGERVRVRTKPRR